jgi:hypothetical protein
MGRASFFELVEHVVLHVFGVLAPVAALQAAEAEVNAAHQKQKEQEVRKENAGICVVYDFSRYAVPYFS